MASNQGDFFPDTDLEELFALLDSGIISNQDFGVEEIGRQIVDGCNKVNFICKDCTKVFKTERGLARHTKTKHELSSTSDHDSKEQEKDEKAANKLHPLHLKEIVISSSKKLSCDQYYPSEIREMFSPESFSFSNEDAFELWTRLKQHILSFNGNAEKFHSEFFGLLVNNILSSKFSDLSISNILLIEVALGIVNHFNKKSFESSLSLSSSTSSSSVLKSNFSLTDIYRTIFSWICCQKTLCQVHIWSFI